MKIKNPNHYEKRLAPFHSNLGFACIISNNPKINGGVVYIQISIHSTNCQRFHFLNMTFMFGEQPFQYEWSSTAVLRLSAPGRTPFECTA
ncbi:hypothetical protein J41TS2_08840 [Bacillus sonorensis]|nr:hypothetical protein J41TS2_08840 [Bacillus sonorensis]